MRNAESSAAVKTRLGEYARANGVGTTYGQISTTGRKEGGGKQAKLSIWESARSPSELPQPLSINSALIYDMIVLNTEEPRLSKTYALDRIPNQVVGTQKGTLFKN